MHLQGRDCFAPTHPIAVAVAERSGTTVEIDPVLADYLREQTNQRPLYRRRQKRARKEPIPVLASGPQERGLHEEGELAEENEQVELQALRASCQGAVSWGTSSGSFSRFDGVLVLQDSKVWCW